MEQARDFLNDWLIGFLRFVVSFWKHVFHGYLTPSFQRFEWAKSLIVRVMYRQRGKYAQVIVNGVVLLGIVLGVSVGPSLVIDDGRVQVAMTEGKIGKIVFAAGEGEQQQVLGVQETRVEAQPFTQVSDKPRAEIIDYVVEQGDTLSSIAVKFGVSMDTLLWLNTKTIESEKDKIKPGEVVRVPPVTGVVHTVKSGETIYSVAKKYDVDPQAVVDFPFNTFTNDETFALAIGQELVVPDGVMPDVKPVSPRSTLARVLTPDAGAVSATGSWIWPAAGKISQGYRSWHPAIDIANRGGGVVLAADSGVVRVAGWPDNVGYGNRVLIDHGNGTQTLYAHLGRVSVRAGQTVKRGNKIGVMGSTGRSTGVHLHFEVRTSKGTVNPLSVLK